ncbi:TetR/AcrR family transcriptional regulator, partial [Sulfitobacter sp. HI0023]|uniref:TetR/AcrR family transcriptional regulator n=2 Tax=Sulfitobacter TaxID=60136 RepID=UPI00191B95A1
MKLTDKKRKDILQAAIQEFREQGFPAARVNRIAELAEVSKRTLYKHFESKEVLFAAITDILLEQIAASP